MPTPAPKLASPCRNPRLVRPQSRWCTSQFARRAPHEHELALELAIADDLASGMDRVAAIIRATTGAAQVEWRARDDDDGSSLGATVGSRGAGREVPLEDLGMFLVSGAHVDQSLVASLAALAPIYRRRRAEEQVARMAIQLLRRNEALEDFAALVAHELKSPLQAALLTDDASSLVEQALDLVDDLLDAARADAAELELTSVAAAFERAVENLGAAEVEITAELGTTSPFPLPSLHVILRNLLANAVAAGARHIHVAAVQSSRSWRLLIEDDGAGLDNVDAYAAGSGVGLSLCRRMAARFGGALELAPRPSGGTRATLVLQEVSQ